MKISIILSFLFLLGLQVNAAVDFKKAFGDREGCFLVLDLKTGKTVAEYNPKRCAERFTPCSSFKIAAALMAFDKGILKDENQVVKWDGIKHERAGINQDLTPMTWMSESAKWVTEWVMPQVGNDSIQHYLDIFSYGNKDFSGGLKDAWVTSSLKISAHEQAAFLSKLWKSELSVSKKATELTKKIISIKELGKSSQLYGKTGTGCLTGHDCMDRPGQMIGTFVGVLESKSASYVFAANASDLKDQGPPAGPRLKKTTIEILTQLGLVVD